MFMSELQHGEACVRALPTPRRPLVIAFGYKSRHGKNCAARAIVDSRRNEFDIREYAFASELKHEVSNAIAQYGNIVNFFASWSDKANGWDELPEWVVMESEPDMSDPLCPFGKHRTLLQFWGTEYRRAQNYNYWVERTAERIASDNAAVALITDFRFLNCGEWIGSVGGYRVKVTRKGFVSNVNQHVSETILDPMPPSYWQHELVAETVPELHAKALGFFDYVVDKERVPRRVQA